MGRLVLRLAATEKDLAHYKERVRVLEAYVSRTTKEIRNLTQDFQIIINYVNELEKKLKEKQGKIAVITTRLKYYENAHLPPSLQSLQYKKREQGDNKQQTEASTKSAKKAGAQKGHKGVSRSHNPDRVMRHTFEHTPICECGNIMTKSGWKQRRITELIPARIEETLHVIEMASCMCGKKQLAPAVGVPESGGFEMWCHHCIACGKDSNKTRTCNFEGSLRPEYIGGCGKQHNCQGRRCMRIIYGNNL